MPPPIIAIMTDFGSQDPFVGIMKGVIHRINPAVRLVDLTHQVPPGDIDRAAIMLWQAQGYFPDGTIFLTVVDPGVGTDRKPIILESHGYRYIGPDNGIFTYCLQGYFLCAELHNPEYQLSAPSKTFHGRDIFAPAAAHAARGVPLEAFGPLTDQIVQLPFPYLEFVTPNQIVGEVLYPDRFGNILTSIGKLIAKPNRILFNPWHSDQKAHHFSPENLRLHLPSGKTLDVVPAFANIPPGDCAAIIGSSGLLEIAAYQGNAYQWLHLGKGDRLQLTFDP